MQQLLVAGGVAANARLRETLERLCRQRGAAFVAPAPALCTDNAAMIAHVGALRIAEAEQSVHAPVRARWPLHELRPPSSADHV